MNACGCLWYLIRTHAHGNHAQLYACCLQHHTHLLVWSWPDSQDRCNNHKLALCVCVCVSHWVYMCVNLWTGVYAQMCVFVCVCVQMQTLFLQHKISHNCIRISKKNRTVGYFKDICILFIPVNFLVTKIYSQLFQRHCQYNAQTYIH